MKKKWIASQTAMAFAMAAMTVLLAAGCDNGMTGAVAAVVAGQQNGTGSNHAPSMPDGEIDDDGVLTKYTGNETAVTIPNGVTGIEWLAFKDCTALTDVAIPASVTSIGWGAFYGCESLETVTYNGTLAQWCAMDNDYELMGYAERVILTGENNRDLKQATTLEIPDGVERIGSSAFYDCTALTDVTIPASVTFIGSNAFYGCTSLKEIVFKGTVEQWQAIQGSDKVMIPCIQCDDGYLGIKDIPECLKMNGTQVTGYTGEVPAALVIPDGVTSIGWGAFRGCTSLETVNIPASVSYISNYAFDSCTSLTSVEIPDSVTSIGECAFELCTSLTGVTIPANMTSIGRAAFWGCESLANVTIPNSVTSIGDNAFYRCDVLKEIRFNGTVEQWKAIQGSDKVMIPCIQCDDGYLGIKDIPECLKMNGTQVVGYTGEVPAELVIPDGVTNIGQGAFEDCTSLESVKIPNGVTEIGRGAFSGCKSLTSVNIPDGVTSIGDVAFYGCTSLTSVNIPDSVKSIGAYAFCYCYALTGVNYGGSEEQWSAITKASNWDEDMGDYKITYNYKE
ncbi:MAG: leucine-rich repeat domain-containing protein [Treponemataceae bacterium]|nr:leucine-rich repeat domain-containing protein [Treponemataceae bacterium]